MPNFSNFHLIYKYDNAKADCSFTTPASITTVPFVFHWLLLRISYPMLSRL